MNRNEYFADEGYRDINPLLWGEENCAPGHSFGPWVRTYWLVHYIISGTGSFRREGVTYRLHAGQAFVIPPYVETFYQADREDPWHYLWVGFECALSGEILPNAVMDDPGLGNLFDDVRRCAAMGNNAARFLCGKIWELLALQKREEVQAGPDYVRRAKQMMKVNYMQGIRVDALAEQLHLDRSYFSSLFRAETGLSPQQYLTRLRLEKAADLMLNRHTSPGAAALSAGYPDIYSFSRMFRRYYGLSPRAWLKSRASGPEERREESVLTFPGQSDKLKQT